MTRNTLLNGAVLACAMAGALFATNNSVAPGLNRFSASLYAQVAKGSGGNLVLSPFSVSSALSMVLAGARGETAEQMTRLLGADAEYQAALAALVGQITKAGNTGDNQFLNANGLWVQEGFKILPEFRDTLQNTYHAPPLVLDFNHNLEGSRQAINTWTERNTHGKIRELFGPGTLNNRTRLVLGSAVYFYGKWEHPFVPTKTHPGPFMLHSGGTEQADFMSQTGTYGYAETADGQILEMRYAGTGFAFDILLPKKGVSVEAMEAGMTPERLAGWIGQLQNRTVQVEIPKFRIESDFPLAKVLEGLGMASAFSPDADFSGIDDRRDLQLSQVIHKAYVDVAEQGTEAAAATGAAVTLIASRIETGPVFRADRPFPFLIRDTRTGLVLFAGRVMNPKH